MASSLYNFARQGFLEGIISWNTGTFRAYLIDTQDYTYDANHRNIGNISDQAKIATTDGALSGKTTTNGVADASDCKFQAVTGDVSEVIIIFSSGETSTGATLICYIDNATGLPVTPNGGDINLVWD